MPPAGGIPVGSKLAKRRVSEVAKELGVDSKLALSCLREMGEFVKTASSTIEMPVARKLKEALLEKAANSAKNTTSDAPATPSADSASTADLNTSPRSSVIPKQIASLDEMSSSAEDKPSLTPLSMIPRPRPTAPLGPNSASRFRTGNNPYKPAPSNRRPAPAPYSPNSLRKNTRLGGMRQSQQGDLNSTTKHRPDDQRHSGGQNAQGRGMPVAKPPMVNFRSSVLPGGRPSSGGARRGGTAGAFGKGGSRAKSRKSKRLKRVEFEMREAPSMGGVKLPRGGGSLVRLRRGASIADFAEKIGASSADLITALFHLGEMATATESLNPVTLEILAQELEYRVEIVSPEDEDREILDSFNISFENEDDESALLPRPPVVTVMGHVDHGKTRLLDSIRNSSTAGLEHGGITQHIGAYQIPHIHEGEERYITFIDTPGHEAFTAMRARGANVTDIVILVVAADDGVMPQTVEALNHAQAANVPIVVAVNKIDVDGANVEKVKAQLTEYGLVAEEFGGDVIFVPVSAKTTQGVGDLLDAVFLTADAALELRANPHKQARGTSIEANLDRGRGSVLTVLVQSGTLRVGDSIVAGTAYGRVRAMLDEHGNNVQEALPSRPVRVQGLSSVPRAGDSFIVTPDDRTARQIAEKREAAERNAQLAKARGRISLEDFSKALEDGKVHSLNLILKGDVAGAVEALEDAIFKIEVDESVQPRVLHRAVGSISESDVNLATVDNAIIIGFNVRPDAKARDRARHEGIDIRFYSVIYDVIQDIEKSLKGMLAPEYVEEKSAVAEVREIFRSSKWGVIAGCIVKDGTITRNSKARVIRDGVVIADKLSIVSLRRFKDDVTEVKTGFECGVGLGFNDIAVGDEIETIELVEVPRA